MARYELVKNFDNSHTHKAFLLEKQAYGANSLPLEFFHQVSSVAPESFIMVEDTVNTNTLVGYISFIPFTDAGYSKVITPGFEESSLSYDDIAPFNVGSNNIYYCSIVVCPTISIEYKRMIIELLRNGFLHLMESFGLRNVYIKNVAMLAQTPASINLCQEIKLNLLHATNTGAVYTSEDFHKAYLNVETKVEIVKLARLRAGLGESK